MFSLVWTEALLWIVSNKITFSFWLFEDKSAGIIFISSVYVQALLNVLRDSHRSRTVFRKVGGFVYVTTVLVNMEGSLSEDLKSPWDTASREQIFTFIHVMFQTLAAAMRQEPANAKFFASEIRYETLTDDIRRLGCLSHTTELLPHAHCQSVTNEGSSSTLPFHNLFDIDGWVLLLCLPSKQGNLLRKENKQLLLRARLSIGYFLDMQENLS